MASEWPDLLHAWVLPDTITPGDDVPLALEPAKRGDEPRYRWVIIRIAEALMETTNLEQILSLGNLNNRLQQLETVLSTRPKALIRGFNVRASETDPEPPLEALLVLLGGDTPGALMDNNPYAGYDKPETYPDVMPGWLEFIPYKSWNEVYKHLLDYYNRVGAPHAGSLVDSAGWLLPGSVIVLEGTEKCQPAEYGAGFYIVQRKLHNGTWRASQTWRVTDRRPRLRFDHLDNEESLEREKGSAAIKWQWRNVTLTVSDKDNARFAVDYSTPSLAYPLAEVNTYYTSLDLDGLLTALSGGNYYYAAMLAIREAGNFAANPAHPIQVAVQYVEIASALEGAMWSPPGDSTPAAHSQPRVILGISIHVRYPELPAIVIPVGPLLPAYLPYDIPEDVPSGHLLDPANRPELPRDTPAFREFRMWRPRLGPDDPESRWIAAMMLNRMRAAMAIRTYFKWPYDPAEWPQEPVPSDPYVVGIDMVWPIASAYFERRPYFTPSGFLNMYWLREAYAPFLALTRSNKDEPPTWQEYTSYALSGDANVYILWYYWCERKIRDSRYHLPPVSRASARMMQVLEASITLEDPLISDTRITDNIFRRRAGISVGRVRPLAPFVFPPAPAKKPAALVPVLVPAPPPAPVLPVVVAPAPKLPAVPAPAPKLPVVVSSDIPRQTVEQARLDLRDWLNENIARFWSFYAPLEARFGKINIAHDIRASWQYYFDTFLTASVPVLPTPSGLPRTYREMLSALYADRDTIYSQLTAWYQYFAAVQKAELSARIENDKILTSEVENQKRTDTLGQWLTNEKYVIERNPRTLDTTKVTVTIASLEATIRSPLHQQSIAALRNVIAREGLGYDRVRRVIAAWSAGLVKLEEGLNALKSVADPKSVTGDAILRSIEQEKHVSRIPIQAYTPRTDGKQWPTDPKELLPVIENPPRDWLANVANWLQQHFRGLTDEYLSLYTGIMTALDKEGVMKSNRLLVYEPARAPDDPVLYQFVPALAVGQTAAKDLINQVLSDGKTKVLNKRRYVFDTLRTGYMDCVVECGDDAPDSRKRWHILEERFARLRPYAMRIDDYLKALVELIASATGWCAYARRRHWAYEPNDRSVVVLNTDPVYRWRPFTLWSDIETKKDAVEEASYGEKEPLTKEERAAGAFKLPQSEYNTLQVLDELYIKAWAAATSGTVKIPNRDDLRAAAFRLLLLGDTLATAWTKMDKDAVLYTVVAQESLQNFSKEDTLDGIEPKAFVVWFGQVTEALLGVDPDAEAHYAAIEAKVLDILLEALPTVQLWSPLQGAPSRWWSGACLDLAYSGSRTTRELEPSSVRDDDLHGATVAITEFLAADSRKLWSPFDARANLKGIVGDDNKEGPRKPVARPTATDIELEAIEAEAKFYRTENKRDDVSDARVFAKWVRKLWSSDNGVRRVLALARTFSRLCASDELGNLALESELTPASFSAHWDLQKRATQIDNLRAEGNTLIYALRIELGVLIQGATSPRLGLSDLLIKDNVSPVLLDVIVLLLNFLDAKPSGRAASAANRLGEWVFQSSALGSIGSLPDASRPAQWTQLAYLLSRDEDAMGRAGRKQSASERLNDPVLVEALASTLLQLVERLEGQRTLSKGTVVQNRHPPPLYDQQRADNYATARLGEQALYRVSWPLAFAQTLRKAYESAKDTTPSFEDVLEFFYDTLLRDDSTLDEQKQVPFFVAAQPDHPADTGVSGFSPRAIADYISSSAFRVEVDVIDQSRQWDLATLLAQSKGRNKATPVDHTAVLRLLMSGSKANRFMLHIDRPYSDLPDFVRSDWIERPTTTTTATHLHERGVYTFVRQPAAPSILAAPEDRAWTVCAPWSRPPSLGVPALLQSLTAVHNTSLAKGAATSLHFNPLYPLCGDGNTSRVRPKPQPGDATFTRLDSATHGASYPKHEWPIQSVQMVELAKVSSILMEKTALLDWFVRLTTLDIERRSKQDYLSLINTDGTLLQAVRREKLEDAIGYQDLTAAYELIRNRWLDFQRSIVAFYDVLSNVFGADAVAEHRDGFVARIQTWVEEALEDLETAHKDARQRIARLFTKKVSEVDIQQGIAERVQKFLKRDEADERKRTGLNAEILGMIDEAFARKLLVRESARIEALISVR